MKMAGRAKKAAPKKKGGYKMPDPIPNGEIIQDTLFKKEWRIGRSIGTGGFGEIYAASDNTSKAKSEYAYAIKIEPSENGPLFVENNFYIRNANKDDITQFMKNKKLSSIGMPTYFGRGTHVCKGVTYRYLVLERYGKDVWSLFKDASRSFKPTTVFQLGLQMLDVLEYIHSRGYVHADLKGANMLLGLKKSSENQVYLVDFGLATRVKAGPFTPNPKCAHDGTIEYTSRDAHLGEPTMRGDLEILGYNMLQWLVGKLPWEDRITSTPQTVQGLKENFMKEVRRNIAKFGDVPDALIKFFEYINSLEPKAIPDYAKCRKLFEGYLKTQGVKINSKIDFTSSSSSKKSKANKSIEENDDDDDVSEIETVKDKKHNGDVPKKRVRKPKVDEVDGQDAPKKRGRKPKADTENKEPDTPKESKKSNKRPSTEVNEFVKKAKLTPKGTPPAKENHLNIATQTSIEKRRSPRVPVRQVRFLSPDGSKNGDSLDSSGDIFDDSFVLEETKPKPKRKLLSKKDETVTVTRVVKKKVTGVKKTKSYKDSATIVNGRSPPKPQATDA